MADSVQTWSWPWLSDARRWRLVMAEWARHSWGVLEPIAYSIPLALWVSYLSRELDAGQGWWGSLRVLGLRNVLLVGTLVVIVTMEIIRARRDEREKRSAQASALRSELSGQRVLAAVLRNTNAAVGKALQLECNARYFPVVELEGVKYLVQARDLHVENIRMPGEYGFTRVPVDDPAFVSARSYLRRTPLYEVLPEDHGQTLYSPDVATMVEARQRWVLVCPVLSIDGATGDLRVEDHPHGVLVFYGVDLPEGDDVDERIREGIGYAQEAAEAFTFVLEIGDAVDGLVR
jgi:hypothetical protein